MSEIKYYQHLNPINSNEADYVIHAKVDDSDFEFEMIPAKKIEERKYQVKCVPFYTSGITYNDLVSTEMSDHYIISKVVQDSGNRNMKIWVKELNKEQYIDLVNKIKSIHGMMMEAYSNNLIAISFPNNLINQVRKIMKEYSEIEIELTK